VSRDLSRGRHVVGDGEQVRKSCTGSSRLRAKGGRDREGEPIKWTGWVPVTKCAAEENPGGQSMTNGPSAGNRAEVIGAQVAKKSLSPERDAPVPQTDTGRQRASSSGERAIPCQGTRQIDPVPLEEGGP
jgi:hypothetical protein